MTAVPFSRSAPEATGPVIRHTAVALPPHAHTQAEIGAVLERWLAPHPLLRLKARSILAHAGVARRHTVRPLDWYLEHPALSVRSAVYKAEMIRLCEQAARGALAGSGVPAEDVGLILSTSCTGLMIPSVEAHLMNRLPFSPHTRRLPLTALGCAAGAAALSAAAEHLQQHPRQAVLLLSCELASLTAQVDDTSLANIVSAALFGDGAAATVLTGADYRAATAPDARAEGAGAEGTRALPLPPSPLPRIVASRSMLFPDTEDMMGFDLADGGLRIFLLPKVPRFLRKELPRQILPFLEEHGLHLDDLRHLLLHPGGRKVLEGLQSALKLSDGQTRWSRTVLRDYGNLSSATVLFMLHHFAREGRPQPGEWGLLAAVGPGFSAELVLLRW